MTDQDVGALDAEEFVAELDREHREPVTAYVRRIVGDHHLAQDVTQETLLRAWRHADRLRSGTGSVRGWLLTVARNIAIDKLRGAVGRRELTREMVSDSASIEPDHADVVGGADHVEQLLALLPPDQRSVVYWSVVVGLTASEVGQKLGIPAGTVKSRKHYALRVLRSRMSDSPERTLAA